ncbi:MAG: 4a-hydroxytetrahydrobiopterin dehydratase [Solirubrobacteraceae bacterium]
MTDVLSNEKISAKLEGSAWKREGEHIVRDWEFKDFAGAIAFVNQVAELAEQANHHPDIIVHGWNKVRLSLTNHSAGGLTDTDFELATKVDALGS